MDLDRAGVTDAEAALAGFIDRFTPDIAARARACRMALRERMPTAIELVYDNYNALAIGYGASEKLGDVVMSLAVYPRNVAAYFKQGTSLLDPERRLRGEGAVGRHVRLDSAATIAEPAVEERIAVALADGGRPLPLPGVGGCTVIKSVSSRQRPRRPGERA